MRSPRLEFPGYVNPGETNLTLAGTGYFNISDLFGGVGPFVIAFGAGTPLISDVLVLAGLNSFMLVTTHTGGGGTMTFQYDILDPELPTTVLATRSISGAIAPTAGLVQTFGAFAVTATTTLGDVFLLIQLRLTANVANQTLTAARLFCGTR
jgi:hypothetical protein